MQDKLVLKVADTLARSTRKRTGVITHPIPLLISNFKAGYEAYKGIFDHYDQEKKLLDLLQQPENAFYFDDELWVSMLFNFMFAYTYGSEEEQIQVCPAITSLYNGKIASHGVELQQFQQQLEKSTFDSKEEFLTRKIDAMRQRLTTVVRGMKGDFVRNGSVARNNPVTFNTTGIYGICTW